MDHVGARRLSRVGFIDKMSVYRQQPEEIAPPERRTNSL